ncbi:MAG: porin [Noviherbaspirillum sp.]|nr:porin [Noviherbaspirillum sp.]
MKKKVLAVAVGAALTLPLAAQAQTSVTVYGKLYPQINSARVYGATAPGTGAVSSLTTTATAAQRANRDVVLMESSNSRIGFRGTEDLGSGLKAIFQLEGSFGVDTGALNTANTLFDQDTFVGLSSGFGTIKLGNMDTVYKSLGDRLSFPRGLASGNAPSLSYILSKASFGAGSNAARFHERVNNNIRYESADYGGFQFMANYALGETAGDFNRGSLFAVGGKYEGGPFYVALAHEVHNDRFGGSTNLGVAAAALAGRESKDTATRLTGQYKITPATRVEANVARLDYDESGAAPAGSFREYKTTTWALSAEHIIGPFTLAASYGQANAGSCTLVTTACSTTGLKGQMAILGGTYALSKRTAFFAYGTHMRNGRSSNYSNLTRQNTNPAGGSAVVAGQDMTQLVVGIDHSF